MDRHPQPMQPSSWSRRSSSRRMRSSRSARHERDRRAQSARVGVRQLAWSQLANLTGDLSHYALIVISLIASRCGVAFRLEDREFMETTLASPNRFARRLFAPLPANYDRLAELLSMGQNSRWRRAMLDHIVAASPSLALDVASGTAGVALQLSERASAPITVIGIDLTLEMLREGQHKLRLRGRNGEVLLAAGRGEQLPFADSTFDALSFAYLLRYVEDPSETLKELARVIRPGGVMASQEFMVPPRPFWRFWWWVYTRLLLPAAGWVLGGRPWYEVGRFLGPNISAHYRRYPLPWTLEAWRRAGFDCVGAQVMSMGGGLVIWGTRSDAAPAAG